MELYVFLAGDHTLLINCIELSLCICCCCCCCFCCCF